MREFAVSLHDVAPATWPACERLLDLLRPYGVPVTLLVTPHLHGGVRADAAPAFGAALRARVADGDETVLHGYWHRDDAPPPRTLRAWFQRRVLTAREGEFAALDAEAAGQRLAHGAAMLRLVGLPVGGFVPPAWLLGPGARAALARSGLRYACTRDWLLPLPDGAPVYAPSLVHSTRSGWRRAVSRGWNRRRLAALARTPRVRAALHPADAQWPAVLDEWRWLLDSLAARRAGVLESAWLPPADGGSAATGAPPRTGGTHGRERLRA